MMQKARFGAEPVFDMQVRISWPSSWAHNMSEDQPAVSTL